MNRRIKNKRMSIRSNDMRNRCFAMTAILKCGDPDMVQKLNYLHFRKMTPTDFPNEEIEFLTTSTYTDFIKRMELFIENLDYSHMNCSTVAADYYRCEELRRFRKVCECNEPTD